ncbi:MAG: DUF2807 domain-containing protein [Bacteroidota bacterium]|nr:DUF2807 domain-containing protein [Bacteroidota bacterium]
MKKILLSFAVMLLAASSVTAQKTVYDNNAEKRTVGSFHAIEVSAGIQVIITKGDKEDLAVSATEKELIAKVETVVKNGVLKISRESDWKFWENFKNSKIKVYVSYTTLDGLEASSGASIRGADVDINKLFVHQSSGALIELSGRADVLDVSGNSGSQFNGYDLKTVTCIANVNSGADVKINVSKEISAKANSGGSIRYKGDGSIRDINVNSGGSVKKQN